MLCFCGTGFKNEIPPGGQQARPLQHSHGGEGFQHRGIWILPKCKRKTQSSFLRTQSCAWVELPTRCSAGDFRISFQYLLPLLPARPAKCVEAKRGGRVPLCSAGVGMVASPGAVHCPGTRGPRPFRSVPVGADGAGRNPTPAAREGRGAAAAREAAASPCDSPVCGDTPSPDRGEGDPGRGRAGRGPALPSPLAERRGGKPASVRCRSAGAMRSCGRARGAAGWAAPLLLLWLCLPTARPYNLDTQHALLFRGGNGTLFGYSVLLHRHGQERW